MEDILNASLAGGVVIGAPSSLFINPAASILCGLGAGIISTLGFIYLSAFLKKKNGLLDTCGVHNLHGIPGILGGILSAIAVASYQSVTLDPLLGN
jgi:ammonium transporter Rh